MIIAKVYVTLKNGILDPQGQTVQHALENLGFAAVKEVRMGKVIQMKFDDVGREEAERQTVEACKKLLANPVIEDFSFELVEETNHHKK